MASEARIFVSLLLALPMLGACGDSVPTPVQPGTGGTSMGTGGTDSSVQTRPYCAKEKKDIAGLATATGKTTGQALVDQVAAAHRITLQGHGPAFPRMAQVQPDSSGVTADLVITPVGTGYRHVKQTEIKCEAGMDCNPGMPLRCWNTFELDVQVTLRSTDGAFNEVWDAVVEFEDREDTRRPAEFLPENPKLVHSFLSNTLKGTLIFPSYKVSGKSSLVEHKIQLDMEFKGRTLVRGNLGNVLTMVDPQSSPGSHWFAVEQLYAFVVQPQG